MLVLALGLGLATYVAGLVVGFGGHVLDLEDVTYMYLLTTLAVFFSD